MWLPLNATAPDVFFFTPKTIKNTQLKYSSYFLTKDASKTIGPTITTIARPTQFGVSKFCADLVFFFLDQKVYLFLLDMLVRI